MRRINHMADMMLLNISDEPVGATKAADTGRKRLYLGMTSATGITEGGRDRLLSQ